MHTHYSVSLKKPMILLFYQALCSGGGVAREVWTAPDDAPRGGDAHWGAMAPQKINFTMVHSTRLSHMSLDLW